jgi:hypothetical protein
MTVQGLAIQGFNGAGVPIDANVDRAVVTLNCIGTDVTGKLAVSAGGTGLGTMGMGWV